MSKGIEAISNQRSQSAWELTAEKTDGRGGPSSCLIAKVIYARLVKCSNEVA
jgi:hypothetical protein